MSQTLFRGRAIVLECVAIPFEKSFAVLGPPASIDWAIEPSRWSA
jgi:hypothetical protein